MKLKTSAHYVLRYNLVYVMVDRIWLVPVMVDGKYKYLKISPLQKILQCPQFIECCIDDGYYISKLIRRLF